MRRPLFACLLPALLLSGCGYHTELKNIQLIYATSLDVNKKNEIVANVTIQSPGGQERNAPTHEIIMATGQTMQESLFKRVALQIAGPVGTAKNQILLISDELARRDLAATLDSTFRSANDPMQSRIAVVPGDASDLIKLERIGSATVGEYLRKIIISAVYETDIPSVTLHSIFPKLFDDGRDAVLPILVREGNKANVKGIALLHDRKYTGKSLSQNQSTLYLLLNGEKGGTCIITRKLKQEEGKPDRYISFNVVKSKRSKQVRVDAEGRVQVNLHVKMKAAVLEYAEGDLTDKKVAAALDQELSRLLTDEARQIGEQLKLADCDAFGIARDLMAFHPQQWKKLDWDRDYRNVDFRMSAEVEIISHGIKN